MRSDGELHEDMARATRAKLLLEDELLMENFRKARDEVVAMMVAAKTDKEALEAKNELRGLERIIKRLHRIFDSGKVAAHELEYRAKVNK